MNFTFTGFILVVLFVLPGAVWVAHFQGHFQARKLNATELVIESIGFSLLVHALLSLALMSCLGLANAVSDHEIDFLSKRSSDLQVLTLWEYWILLIAFSVYILLSCGVGYGLARLHCRIAERRELPRHRAVWLNFFGPTEANFVKAKMNDGYAYIGQLKHYPFDYESIHSSSRDIVLTDVVIEKGDGTIENPAPGAQSGEKVDVLLKTNDIQALELVRAASDQA